MAKRSRTQVLADQLDEAVEVLMTHRGTELPAVESPLNELLRIAADLQDLPSVEFTTHLKADLQRGRTAVVQAVPAGYHTATPCLVVSDPPRAIDFYKRAFNATEVLCVSDPHGDVLHAEMAIGDSRVALAPEMPTWGNHSPRALGGSPVIVQLYVDDVDALATQAVAAGAEVLIPIADQFYGDRAGRLKDPFGHIWIVGTHKEDVTAEEMNRRVAVLMAEAPASEPTQAPRVYRIEPYLPVRDAGRLLAFLKQAFDAQEVARHMQPDNTIKHAEVTIGDATLTTGDSGPAGEAMPTALHLYVPDADAAYARALHAGATSMQVPTDQPYGDREAGVRDPFGNNWYIATHTGTADEPAATHVPAGLRSVTPYLHPRGAAHLIEFLTRAFGAQEQFRAQAPDGTVMHAKVRIGESMLEMGEAQGAYQPMPTIFHLYVPDTDAAYRHACAAGATSLAAPADQPWGCRNAGVLDPSGNQWWINQRREVNAGRAGEVATTNMPPRAQTVTAFLQVRQVRPAIDFLQNAFGAELSLLERGGDPPHDHAEMTIGESTVMIGETIPGYEVTTAAFYLRIDDVDTAYERARRAGAMARQAPADMPWGDRMAHIQDPFGNSWYLATRKKAIAS